MNISFIRNPLETSLTLTNGRHDVEIVMPRKTERQHFVISIYDDIRDPEHPIVSMEFAGEQTIALLHQVVESLLAPSFAHA